MLLDTLQLLQLLLSLQLGTVRIGTCKHPIRSMACRGLGCSLAIQ